MAVYRDNVEGEALTEQEQQIVAQYDQGKTDAELAEMFGYTNPGSAGNVRRRALTKLGRGSEVRGGGGSRSKTTAPRIRGVAALLMEGYAVAKRTVESLTERISEAKADADVEPDQMIEREVTRLTTKVSEAQEALDKFESQSDADKTKWAEAQIKAAQTNSEKVQKDLTASLTEAQAAMEEIVAQAEALEIDLESETDSNDQADDEEPSGNSENA